jgi:CheY-like chemotaxis protein
MEAIGQLAGGVAHDFNNLLTAIEGYYELAAEQLPPDHPAGADLLEIHHAAQRAVSLTRQLLAFGRRQILEPRVLDLRQSLKSIVPMLKRLIGEDINIVVRAAQDPGRVKADPGQIEQVLLNLAVNARDAMPKGGTLSFEVESLELEEAIARRHADVPAGRYVMLATTDTGIGMDQATLSRIFEPFFTTKTQGTGLGLSTVYGIIKQSGGHLWVYSEPGHGTTFKVYLPRVDAAVDSTDASTAPAPMGGTETILVVEDDASVRDLVNRTLKRHGYDVLSAQSPAEAVAMVGRGDGTIHLLLSDVILPQMSGSTMASALAQWQPGMKVLYMSGYTDDAVLRHGALDEGVAFLQKPFTSQALARKVREVLG